MEIHFAGELLRRVLVRASPTHKICLVAHCAALYSARATRWGVALWCGSVEQQDCPLQMLRTAVSGLPSRKSEFPVVFNG